MAYNFITINIKFCLNNNVFLPTILKWLLKTTPSPEKYLFRADVWENIDPSGQVFNYASTFKFFVWANPHTL